MLERGRGSEVLAEEGGREVWLDLATRRATQRFSLTRSLYVSFLSYWVSGGHVGHVRDDNKGLSLTSVSFLNHVAHQHTRHLPNSARPARAPSHIGVTNDGQRAPNDGLTAGSKDEIDGLKSTRNPFQVLLTLSDSSTHNTFRDASCVARDDMKKVKFCFRL